MTTAPHCRYCGKAISKRTRHVYLVLKLDRQYHHDLDSRFGGGIRYLEVAAYPKTKDECQKLTNWQVVGVRRAQVFDDDHNVTKPHIGSFFEWDGESYEDSYFCNGDHAKSFGYAAARSGLKMKT